ncbi:MAG: glycosyltransferase family 4 protein [Muribaculum sp.]|nr:glycosyltransferase family 4 protein [Muribaculum sp.]
MKSIYLISNARICGPVNQAFNIVSGLCNSEEVDTTLVTISPEIEGKSWLCRFEEKGLPHHCLNTSRFGLITAIRELRRYLKENQIDIIHSSGFRANLIASFMPGKYKKISTQRCSPDDIGEKFPKLLRPLITKTYLKIIDRLDYNVACSKTLQAIFANTFNRKVGCVQNCVNTEYFKPCSAGEREALRNELGLDLNKNLFLVLGSLRPRKDNITVIKAFNELKDINAQLIIVGDGPEMNLLKSESKNPNILFVGQTSVPIKYLQACDTLISCSLAEGLPNTVLEAISCGLTCILSDIGSHREIIENTSAGVLFPTRNTESLEKCIVESMGWDEQKNTIARELAISKFSIPSLAKKYLNIYTAKI